MTVRFGLIGLGYWGPNYARILARELPGARLVACADGREDRLALIGSQYPEVRTFADHRDLVAAVDVDAVVVATPSATHGRLALDCLQAGKHVLVEKPMATNTADARAMVEAAAGAGRQLMVGHTFLFNPAVRRIKRYLEDGDLGSPLYLHFQRTGLGPIRRDVNALWDLAPHDFSMLRYWLGGDPIEVSARGESYLQPSLHDVVFVTLRLPGRVMASVHVSWLDPVKIRRATLVGDRKMVVFDDVDPTEKLRVYDKGVSYQPTGNNYAEFLASVRDGDILVPRLELREPLKEQARHFVDCITEGRRPIADGEDGLAVVMLLERAQLALEQASETAVHA